MTRIHPDAVIEQRSSFKSKEELSRRHTLSSQASRQSQTSSSCLAGLTLSQRPTSKRPSLCTFGPQAHQDSRGRRRRHHSISESENGEDGRERGYAVWLVDTAGM